MVKKPKDIQNIDDRIAVMKEKATEKAKAETDNSAYPGVSLAFQVGIELASGVFVGAGLGYILDEVFDFKFVCLLIFTIFGCIAGLLNVSRYLKRLDEDREGK